MRGNKLPSVLIITLGLFSVLVISAALETPNKKEMEIREKLKKVQTDWQALEDAIYSYEIDRCGIYKPPDTMPRRRLYPDTFLTFETEPEFINNQPVGAHHIAFIENDPLTTPIAYIDKIPMDPFNPGHYYGYTCWTIFDLVYELALFHSPGPDGKTDLSLITLREKLDPYFQKRSKQVVMNTMELTGEEKTMVKNIITPHLYDPTNGLVSQGDLILWLDLHGEFGSKGDTWADSPASDDDIYNKVLNGFPQKKTWDNQPTHMKEFMSQREKVKVPTSMLKVFHEAGITLQKELTSGERPLLKPVFPLYNHIKQNYKGFFKSPGSLSKAELESLQDWKKTSPQWWNALAIDTQGRTTGEIYPTGSLTPLLPVYGKSMLLWAGEELSYGNISAAYLIYRTLSNDLLFIQNSSNIEYPSPHYTRIMSQLTEMLNKLYIEIAHRDSIARRPVLAVNHPSPYAVYMIKTKMLLIHGVNSNIDKWKEDIDDDNNHASYLKKYIENPPSLNRKETLFYWNKEHPYWWQEMKKAPEYWLSSKVDQVPLNRQKTLILNERKDSPGFSYDSVLAVAICPYMASQLLLIDEAIDQEDIQSAKVRLDALEIFIQKLDPYQRKQGKLISETRQIIDRKRQAIQ